jgi:hypothetical protein
MRYPGYNWRFHKRIKRNSRWKLDSYHQNHT